MADETDSGLVFSDSSVWKTVSIDPLLRQHFPDLRLGILLADVAVQPRGEALDKAIRDQTRPERLPGSVEAIKELPAIASTRQAFRLLGKDPSRYRPSAEALLRRVLTGKGLYAVNNAVDALNLVSLSTGFSIGGYDAGKIRFPYRLGRGESGMHYEGIGRGAIHLEGLPVLFDLHGPFGSPCSDSVRTAVTGQTRFFIWVFFDFNVNDQLHKALNMSEKLLMDHVGTRSCKQHIFSVGLPSNA